MLRRLHLIAFVLTGLLLMGAGVVRAEIQELEQHRDAVTKAIERGSVNLEYTVSKANKQGFAAPLVFGILGGEPEPAPDGAYNPDGTRQVVYSKGLLGDMGTAIAMLYKNKPADTGLYVADVLNNMGIASPAYAQGLGFSSLTPILSAWKKFRNMAYFFFVIIFLVIGFLIMLRQKIGGQAAVTAQQAIPHIIITLLFVTFSYALAGLLIDIMYLFMFLLLGLFGKAPGEFVGLSFIQLGFKLASAGATTAFNAVSAFSESFEQAFGEVGQEAVEVMGGLTMAVVVALAIALNVFRLFFELLKTYVTIILNIVFAPILLAFGAIPNGKNIFGEWVKNLVGNLAAFPAVLLIMIVFDELTGGLTGGASPIETGGFMPPYLFGRSVDGAAGALTFSVGLGAILIMPEIVVQAKKAMGAKGGIFDQFAKDAWGSIKRGWGGGELVEGLAMTNTNKLPLVGKYVGSGKKITQGAATLATGGVAGVGAGLWSGGRNLAARSPLRIGTPGPNTIAGGWGFGKKVGGGVARGIGYEPAASKDKKTP